MLCFCTDCLSWDSILFVVSLEAAVGAVFLHRLVTWRWIENNEGEGADWRKGEERGRA